MSKSTAPAIAAVGIFCFLACIGTQIFYYLKTGVWYECGLITTAANFGLIKAGWAYNPTDWVGLHKSLEFINAGFAALSVSMIAASIADSQ